MTETSESQADDLNDPARDDGAGRPSDVPATGAAEGRLGASYRKLFGASVVSNLGDGVALVAYPWLASAVTRNALLIALVAVVQRLPWLVFSLPAGVITDRNDRRTIIVGSNVARALVTAFVAVAVFAQRDDLPSPDEISDGLVHSSTTLYLLVLVATLLLGVAEVLGDNSTQTFMPSIVRQEHLEKANGRLWSAEMIANTFVGPPLGAALLVWSFTAPFGVDAASFALAALLVWLIPAGSRRSTSAGDTANDAMPQQSMKAGIKEGFGWLWRHDLLRPMAIILGLLNMFGIITMAAFVLFAQEVLETSPTEFALVTTGGAVGGVIGGWTASAVSKKIGSGPSLWTTLVTGSLTSLVIGFSSNWIVVWFMFALGMGTGVLWNVITVSLRQTIIPDHLLGRVNSVYRFFAWGMLPIGALLGGAIVAVVDLGASRDVALRAPWIVAAVGQMVLFVFAAPKLTTAKMEAAKSDAVADTTGGVGPG